MLNSSFTAHKVFLALGRFVAAALLNLKSLVSECTPRWFEGWSNQEMEEGFSNIPCCDCTLGSDGAKWRQKKFLVVFVSRRQTGCLWSRVGALCCFGLFVSHFNVTWRWLACLNYIHRTSFVLLNFIVMSLALLFHSYAKSLSVELVFPQCQICSISVSVCSQNDYCSCDLLSKNKWYKRSNCTPPCAVYLESWRMWSFTYWSNKY